MERPRYVDPPQSGVERWVDFLRRLVVFALGVGLILDALIQAGSNVPELVVGAVLLGVAPLDALLSSAAAARRPESPRHRRRPAVEDSAPV